MPQRAIRLVTSYRSFNFRHQLRRRPLSRRQLSISLFYTIRDYISEHSVNRHLDLLSELIQRDKNHPSVVMWSVASHSATAYSRNIGAHLKRMMSFTREMDLQKRPVTYVASSMDRMMIVEDPAVSLWGFKLKLCTCLWSIMRCWLKITILLFMHVQSLKQSATLLRAVFS